VPAGASYPRWQADAAFRVDGTSDDLHRGSSTDAGLDSANDPALADAGDRGLVGDADVASATERAAGPRGVIQVGKTPEAGDAGEKGALFLLPGQIQDEASEISSDTMSSQHAQPQKEAELQELPSDELSSSFRGLKGDALDFRRGVRVLLRQHRDLLFKALQVSRLPDFGRRRVPPPDARPQPLSSHIYLVCRF
jgi:hypothetical protein